MNRNAFIGHGFYSAQEGELRCQGIEPLGKTGSHWGRMSELGAGERVKMLVTQGTN